MKTQKSLLAAIVFAGGSLSFAGPSEAAERWLFNCFFPPQHYICTEVLPELKNRVEAATGKRVRVTIPPKSLAAPPDQFDGVVNGVMDGALQFNQFISNRVAGIQVGQLPFVGIESSEAGSVALWKTYQQFFADKNEYGDVHLLSVYASNGAEFYSMTDKPIGSVDDIAARKMWALPGVTANLVKATGSPVVAGPAVQMLEIISKGVVDGYVGVPISSVLEFKLGDYTRSATVFKRKVFTPTFSFFVSNKKWAAVSQTDREAIDRALGEDFARFVGRRADKAQQAGRRHLEEKKIAMVDGDPKMLDALDAYGQPVIDAWVERVGKMGVDGRKAVAFYRGMLAQEERALSAR
ncbi:MAG: TRAP transporter substrate-binding protein DctP [Burkholderiaceae bacterium]